MAEKSDNLQRERFYERLFAEWSEGLTPLESRVAIFSHIRDIPYAIIPEWQGSDLVRMMITQNKGWCGPKHHLLLWMFNKLLIPTRFASIPFRWQDQPVQYPGYLKEYFSTLSGSTHLLCRVYLNGEWKNLDATWDPPLRRVGFPINDPWDGISSTIPAVIQHCGQEKKEKISTLEQWENWREFIKHLNLWLDEIRKENTELIIQDNVMK
jgi:hypothetical protein